MAIGPGDAFGEANKARSADEWACASLAYRYALYADRERERVCELLAEDGTLEFEMLGITLSGRAAIAERFKPRQDVVTLHFCTNVVVDIVGEHLARGTVHLLSFGGTLEVGATVPLPMPAPRSAGIYHDTYVRQGNGWFFKSRRLQILFKGHR